MSVDIDAANRLLQKKYEEGTGAQNVGQISFGPAGTAPEINKKAPQIRSVLNTSDWEIVAHERLQMVNQLRDEMQAWNEAYLKERERGDRLEARLFDVLNLNKQ